MRPIRDSLRWPDWWPGAQKVEQTTGDASGINTLKKKGRCVCKARLGSSHALQLNALGAPREGASSNYRQELGAL